MEFVMMISAYQDTPYFVMTALPRKNEGRVILYVKSNLLPKRVLLSTTIPSSLYVSLMVCELLFNAEPSTTALVYLSGRQSHFNKLQYVYVSHKMINFKKNAFLSNRSIYSDDL